MRLHHACVALLACTIACAEDGAEAFFKQVEERVANASTIQVKFEVESSKPMEGKITGELKAKKGAEGEKDKLRYSFAGEINGQQGETLVVSDGKKLVATETGRTPEEKDASDGLAHSVLEEALRAGAFFGPSILCRGTMTPERVQLLKTEGIKLGEKETVDGVECQVLRLATSIGDPKAPQCDTTIWVDTKTMLPVKFEVVASSREAKVKISEAWKEASVEGKIDDKTFELPK